MSAAYQKHVTEACGRLRDALSTLPDDVWNHDLKSDFGMMRNWAELRARDMDREQAAHDAEVEART